ncbi:hypothetical protein CI109_105022 [Kwoniella shandongensis]|uniref:Uncharacterized protein n=1 Tax=Kwoniella shandongensis TaxID=1734106 RepID=A0A5M6C242_9TREE|nr:uncharacterized protein CI109_004379 [Kwoniella shandongensis]KAA5527319.1 hypothetical protein CI109_004379 [Kwoniella shandongensis]
MLSSSPAIPLTSIDFSDSGRRRLSLVTAHGQEIFTAHDGLPSPEHLTPISGTPMSSNTPMGSEPNSAPLSRRGSDMVLDKQYTLDAEGGRGRNTGAVYHPQHGADLTKVPSRGGFWHDPDTVSFDS